MAQALAIGSIVLTAGSLVLAAAFARKQSRIRLGFDAARAVVGVAAILVMAAIAGVATPAGAMAGAILGGLALGLGQGWGLKINPGERGFYARRSPLGIVLWGAGIVVMQAAGIAARTGAVQAGQAVAWFSACLGIGLMMGRNRPLQGARQRLAGGTLAIIVAILVLAAAFAGVAAPAAAQTVQLTNEEVCDLIPAYQGEWDTGSYDPGHDSADESLVADCYYHVSLSADQVLMVNVRLHFSDQSALDSFEFVSGVIAEQAVGVATSLGIGDVDRYWAWTPTWDAERRLYESLVVVGPFLIRVTGNNADTIAAAAAAAAAAGTLLPPVATTTTAGTTSTSPVDTTTTEATTEGGTTTTAAVITPPSDAGSDDEAITPGEAAGQAVAGLIAAAAIGLITWGEAAAEAGRIAGDGRRGSPGAAAPSPPYIDPLDGRPLPVDPSTGRVFWPWDGGSGHWVDASEAPGLIAQWDRELEAETARRVGRHDAQREQNWQDLHDRIRRSEAEEAARRAAEQARLDAFDRRVEAARAWMEEADAGSLVQLDRILERAANQGFVTDQDLAQASSIADRARVWADTRRRWDADDWIRITANRNAVLGATAKGISILIDPTKGLASGFIWGVAESWDRGDDLATVVANGVLEGAVLRGGYAVGTWEPGRAALGNIGWGSVSGAGMAAGEALVRGGTLEEMWEAGKTGFVLGGLGGVAEDAVAVGRPPADLPTIRNRPGGGTHYDQPLSPRHIDPGDPRYRPPGTPADQIHLPPSDWPQTSPKLIETEVPLGGRPLSTPEPPPPGIDAGDIELDAGDIELPPPRPTPQELGLPEHLLVDPDMLPPPTPEELLAGARPTRPSGDILDDMMQQPRHPAVAEPPPAGRVPDWQRGFFPDAEGRTMIDTDGRVIAGNRQIGSVDPDTGTLQNLNGEPMTVALDHRGVPIGYLEHPDVPPGMQPAYNARGELAGYVDQAGRADLGGQRVPAAIDADGRLIPYEAPAGGPVGPGPEARLPVLDENGAVAHFVEPGPREIHYDANGVPYYVQRQHPVQGTTMRDIVLDPSRAPAELQRMPTPEVFDATESWCPLVGEGAPPTAPPAGPTSPQGGEG
ncbi:MAG TPA: hypothetical protein VLS92_00685 [Acidimicrobiia bacterium]|nr:hypothetical protein [Acidimicrobiia bacterium]